MMSEALRKESLRMAGVVVPGITVVTIACMIVMRDMLRDAYLKPYFSPGQFAVKTQWEVLPLFLALFVGGAILWFVMLMRYGMFGSRKAAPKA